MHSISIEAVTAFFCKYTPHTEKGKEYFQPSKLLADITDYHRVSILPEYKQLKDKQDRALPYILHVPTSEVYALP